MFHFAAWLLWLLMPCGAADLLFSVHCSAICLGQSVAMLGILAIWKPCVLALGCSDLWTEYDGSHALAWEQARDALRHSAARNCPC